MRNNNIRLFREYEQAIDSYYKELPYWKYQANEAIYGLLAAFDSYSLVNYLAQDKTQSQGAMDFFKCLQEGFVIAMSWLLNHGALFDAKPTQNENLIDSAASLIEYGKKYFNVSVFHITYGKGDLDISVDSEKKHVKFILKEPQLSHAGCWGYLEAIEADKQRFILHKIKRKEELFKIAARDISHLKYHTEDGRIVLDDINQLKLNSIYKLATVDIELHKVFPPGCDLGGFTINEYDCYWTALLIWSICCNLLYFRSYHEGIEQAECMPTQVIERREFIENISVISELKVETIEIITNRILYDKRTKNPDIFLQPLVCGKSMIAWSVYLIQLSRYQRNMLKLMARTPSLKTIADEIVGQRERELLQSIGRILSKNGWSFQLNTRLFRGKKGEIDLIGYNVKFPNEVLIIETKALLQANDINETYQATDEMKHGQKQVRCNIDVLKNMSLNDKQRLCKFINWKKVEKYYGMVVTPETDPNVNYDQSVIPAASLETLRRRLRTRDWRQPSRLWESLCKCEWLWPFHQAELSHAEVELAGITYSIPTIKLADEKNKY